MPHPIAPVLNDTSITPRIASQPEDASPSPAAHLLHNSQEDNPVPVAPAEVVVERSFRSPPGLAKANLLPAFDVGDAIDGIFDETCGLGCSADADAFGKDFGTTGPGVEVREGVEAAIEIAANTASTSYFPSTQPTRIDRFTNHDTSLYELGYDSEGNLPYYDPVALEEDADEYEEPSIGLPTLPLPPGWQNNTNTAPGLTLADVSGKMSVKEIKAALKQRGQTLSGNKSDLLSRLKDALITNLPVLDVPVERDAGMTGLDVTAEWVLLEPDPIPIPEPTNKDDSLRPPTERDAS